MLTSLFLLLLTALLPMRVEAAPAPSLEQQIQQLLAQGDLSQAQWGIYIQDVESGEVLAERGSNSLLIPASTMKVLTAATAIDVFGPSHRFRTTLYFDGELDGATLRGDLIIRGSGDPTFGTSEMPLANPLQLWARGLKEMGIERIEGRVIGDDNVFSDRYYADGWDITYMTEQASRSLGVSSSGLSYNDNVVRLRVRSGAVGEPPQIEADPARQLEFDNRATTANRRRGWALDFERNIGTEEITVTGSVPRSYSGTIFMPVTNPTTFTAQSFINQLEAADIAVTGSAIDIDEVDVSLSYEDLEPIFVYYSPQLRDILSRMNKESINFYAEQIFRAIAYDGSPDGGEDRIKDFLTEAGVETRDLSLRDGSGLSRKDLVTPQALAGLLRYMDDHPHGAAFRSTLAEGGERNSTLRYRLRGLPVTAKTGSLEFVRGLTGYVETQDGREVAFALLANNYGPPSYRIVQTFDRIVRAIHSSTS